MPLTKLQRTLFIFGSLFGISTNLICFKVANKSVKVPQQTWKKKVPLNKSFFCRYSSAFYHQSIGMMRTTNCFHSVYTARLLSGNVAVRHSVTSSIPSNDRWQCLSQRRDTHFRQLSLVVQTETLYMMDDRRGHGEAILSERKLGSSVGRQLTEHNILVSWTMLLNPKCRCQVSKKALQPQKVYDSTRILDESESLKDRPFKSLTKQFSDVIRKWKHL